MCEVSDMAQNKEQSSYSLTVHGKVALIFYSIYMRTRIPTVRKIVVYYMVSDEDSSFLHLSIIDNKTEWTEDAGLPTFQWIVNVTSYPRSGISWR